MTLIGMIKNSTNLYCNETAYKIKKDGKFIPITYLELYQKVEDFGTGLLAIGIKSFDHIGLISNNRFEWIVADLAIIGLRAIDVPCNGNSSSQDIRFKLNHSDCNSVILEGKKQFSNFNTVIKDLPNVKNIILMDGIDMPYNADKHYYSFQEILEIGEKLLLEGDTSFYEISKHAKPDDLVTIIYTSGATSNPKGVMLTNSNFMHSIGTIPQRFGLHKERFLAILPPWHIGERGMEYIALSVGSSIAYSKPLKQILLPDLRSEKPTILVCVPLIWESIYKGIINNIKRRKNIQKSIFDWAIKVGKECKKTDWKYKLADKLIFGKIRKAFGGKLKFAVSGGAKLPEDIYTFFDIIGINIRDGYALTEAFIVFIK